MFKTLQFYIFCPNKTSYKPKQTVPNASYSFWVWKDCIICIHPRHFDKKVCFWTIKTFQDAQPHQIQPRHTFLVQLCWRFLLHTAQGSIKFLVQSMRAGFGRPPGPSWNILQKQRSQEVVLQNGAGWNHRIIHRYPIKKIHDCWKTLKKPFTSQVFEEVFFI